MSYVVLARKYRPRDFTTLVGQPHVVQALVNALTQQRLHHAYLFTGTRGVGKTTVSRILAKSLNCTGADGHGGITAQPCGVCDACRDIDSGRFIDYVELDAASNRGVEEISQLLDQAVYKPVLGRFKVYMIDEVHMLTNTAFNAMLKTLEEPPDYLKFVLATTDPQKVPPTVLSRCLQFNLRPMAPQTVQQHLAEVLSAEGIAAEAGALRLLANAARGSMRDGLSLADQAIAYGAGVVDEAGVREMLGAVDRSHALRLVERLAERDGAGVVAAVDELRVLGLSAASTLEEMVALLQQIAVLQVVPEARDVDDSEAITLMRLAQRLPRDDTQLLYSIVLHGRAELALSPDEYSGLVMVLLRMLAFAAEPAGAPAPTESVDVARPIGAIGTIDAAAATGTTASTASTGRLPVVAPILEGNVAELGDRWVDVVRRMIDADRIGALVRELALQAQCVAIDSTASPQLWRLRVERETLRATAQRDKLQTALAEVLGEPARIEIEAGRAEGSPASRDAAERSRKQAEAERVIHGDPLVQALMAQYKTARIVPGSVQPYSVSQEQQT